MSDVLANFNIGENFWVVNPQFLTVKIFKKLHSKEGKKKSSLWMWAIALLVAQGSIYRNLRREDRKNIIAEDFLKDKEFNWGVLEEEIEVFEDIVLSFIERDVNDIRAKLEERNTFIKDTSYTLDSAKRIDEILLNTSRIHEMLDKAVEKLNKDKVDGITRGGMRESSAEKGEI